MTEVAFRCVLPVSPLDLVGVIYLAHYRFFDPNPNAGSVGLMAIPKLSFFLLPLPGPNRIGFTCILKKQWKTHSLETGGRKGDILTLLMPSLNTAESPGSWKALASINEKQDISASFKNDLFSFGSNGLIIVGWDLVKVLSADPTNQPNQVMATARSGMIISCENPTHSPPCKSCINPQTS